MIQIANQLAVAKAVSERRRQLAATSPEVFAQVYLGNHFVLSPSRMHKELFETVAKATEKPECFLRYIDQSLLKQGKSGLNSGEFGAKTS